MSKLISKFSVKSHVIVFASLPFVLCATLGSAQEARYKPLPKEELEKYDQPPAYIWRTDVSQAMVSQYGAFTSYQVNVNASGQNITGDAANEPSICVDPTNRNKMSIGWRQFNSIGSNFRQAGWGYTTNGGLNWSFPGVLENNVFRSDPVLNSDSAGTFFYLSLLQDFFDDIWRSNVGGTAWARVAPATGGDKQWMTIDNTSSSGHGFQYQWWSTGGNNYNGRQFSRSTNGGASWLDPVNIPNNPVWGTLDVDTIGNLFLGGVNLDTHQNWCIRSSNARIAAAIPTFDLATPVNLGGNVVFGEPINPDGIVGQMFLVVDRSGTSTNNNIYMLASVQPAGFSNGAEVMFARSTNGGQSFSAPRRINDDPVNHDKWHWFGTLAVAPNGRIDVVWLDTRAAANNTTSQLYYSYSSDGGNTWSISVPASNPFSPYAGFPQQNKIGDYMTIVSDNTGGNVAYSATFNNEQDVYYVHVTPAATLPVIDFNGDGLEDYVLFNSSTRKTAIWNLRGGMFLNGEFGPDLPQGWTIASVADVDHDSKPDYILQNASTRKTAIWYLNNATFVSAVNGPTLPSGWSLVATADINRDGQLDYVLFQASTGQTAVWYLNGTALSGSSLGPTLPPGWTLVDALDFNADGKPDFELLNPSTHQTAIWYLNGASRTSSSFGPTLPAGWTLEGAGDFNSDAKPDYVIYEAATRRTALWYLNGAALVSGTFGPTLAPGFRLVSP